LRDTKLTNEVGFFIEEGIMRGPSRLTKRVTVAQDTLRDMFGYLGRPQKEFEWERLAVLSTDFEEFNLLPIPVKKGDPRSQDFRNIHGEYGAEVDALPMAEIRNRVESAIVRHVNPDTWQTSVHRQQSERASIRNLAQQI
jgi:hypothetical protein